MSLHFAYPKTVISLILLSPKPMATSSCRKEQIVPIITSRVTLPRRYCPCPDVWVSDLSLTLCQVSQGTSILWQPGFLLFILLYNHHLSILIRHLCLDVLKRQLAGIQSGSCRNNNCSSCMRLSFLSSLEADPSFGRPEIFLATLGEPSSWSPSSHLMASLSFSQEARHLQVLFLGTSQPGFNI